MGKSIHDAYAEAREAFDEVGEATGLDLRSLCFESDEETLRQTQNAQIALFTVSVATFRALGDHPTATAMAGHSVGEYAALVCAGVVSVEVGARLVQRRGDLMARAGALRPGAMAAILGLGDDDVDRLCMEATTGDMAVVVANYNSPGQVVVSGDSEAVAGACELAKQAGAKRCIQLNVSGAFHSPLMKDSAAAMGEALSQASFAPSEVPVISNVTAEPGSEWATLLQRQLESPVRWAPSVLKMREMGISTFVECGSGEVLTGLLKRIDPDAKGLAVNSPEGVDSLRQGVPR